VVATTPGLAEVLARDWRKAARFYARFAITEEQFRHRVTPASFSPLEIHAEESLFAVDGNDELHSSVELPCGEGGLV